MYRSGTNSSMGRRWMYKEDDDCLDATSSSCMCPDCGGVQEQYTGGGLKGMGKAVSGTFGSVKNFADPSKTLKKQGEYNDERVRNEITDGMEKILGNTVGKGDAQKIAKEIYRLLDKHIEYHYNRGTFSSKGKNARAQSEYV